MVVKVRDAARTPPSPPRGVSESGTNTKRVFDDRFMAWSGDQIDPHITTRKAGYPTPSIDGPQRKVDGTGHRVTDTPFPIIVSSTFDGTNLRLEVTDILTSEPLSVLEIAQLNVNDISVLGDVTDAVSPELATNPVPGVISGNGIILSPLAETLEVGAVYLVSYEIAEDAALTSLFFSTTNGSPFPSTTLSREPGVHHVLVSAVNTNTAAIMRASGDAAFLSISCRKAEWTHTLGAVGADAKVSWSVAYGSLQYAKTFYTPTPGEWYVSIAAEPAGTGGIRAPFQSLAEVDAVAGPGDTVYVLPGTYEPYEWSASGAPGNPIVLTTRPGEELQWKIKGDFDQHIVHGGPGIIKDNSKQDGLRLAGCSHVEVYNLSVEWTSRNAIMIEGAEGELMDTIKIAACKTRNSGSSGISCIGFESGNDVLPVGAAIRIQNVLFELNDIAQTNLPSDYRQGEQGVVEAISVGKAVANAVTRYNHIHDTLQYAIDYKHGVAGGEIYGNVMERIQKHGIYLDTNRRYLTDIKVYNNIMIDCGTGITLAREADFDGTLSPGTGTFENPEPGSPLALEYADMQQTLKRIDVFNNIVIRAQTSGLYVARHKNTTDPSDGSWISDSPHGTIEDVRIRFNIFYDCGRSGSSGNEMRTVGWSDQVFRDANVVKSFELIGNIAYRPAGNPITTNIHSDEFDGLPNFTLAMNLIGDESDRTINNPLFVNPTATPVTIFDYINPPVVGGINFDVQAGSPAIDLVTGNSLAPFNVDFGGAVRGDPANAGAYA